MNFIYNRLRSFLILLLVNLLHSEIDCKINTFFNYNTYAFTYKLFLLTYKKCILHLVISATFLIAKFLILFLEKDSNFMGLDPDSRVDGLKLRSPPCTGSV